MQQCGQASMRPSMPSWRLSAGIGVKRLLTKQRSMYACTSAAAQGFCASLWLEECMQGGPASNLRGSLLFTSTKKARPSNHCKVSETGTLDVKRQSSHIDRR